MRGEGRDTWSAVRVEGVGDVIKAGSGNTGRAWGFRDVPEPKPRRCGVGARVGGLCPQWWLIRAGLPRGWGFRPEATGMGGGDRAAASPGPVPLSTPNVGHAPPRLGLTLWSSMAAAQVVPSPTRGPRLLF